MSPGTSKPFPDEPSAGGGPGAPPFARPPSGDVALSGERLVLPDGYETPVLHHAPPGGATGAPVLYVHGIQSHPGWYVGSAEALARGGHHVFQVTRRGSGTNARDRGHARSAGQLLGDLDAAVDHVRGRTGAERAAVVAVSWGGKLAAAYALARPERVASLTLVAPGICPRVDVPWPTKLAVAACRLPAPRRRFAIPLNDPELFTDEPNMRAYLEGDRCRLHRATAGLLVASRLLDHRLRRARPGALAVPTTLMLARRDRILDNRRTRALVERLTGGSAEVVEFDAAHTIEFEPDPGPFYEALCRSVRTHRPGHRA